MSEIVFTDRYQAMGIPYPDTETMCNGQCEGTGLYPQQGDDEGATRQEMVLWDEAHAKAHGFKAFFRRLFQYPKEPGFAFGAFEACDGWHFIRCPDCDGSGKRNTEKGN